MQVAVIMGSSSDQKIADKVIEKLEYFGIEHELRIISAHRAHDILVDYVKNSDAKIFIAIAGKAAHLAGVIAGLSTKPVIGIPVKSSTMDGLDSLLSTVQMPKGVPVATVAIDGGENAGILAVQMLAIADENLEKKLIEFKAEQARESVK